MSFKSKVRRRVKRALVLAVAAASVAGPAASAERPVNAPGATAVDSQTRPAPAPALPGPPTWPVDPAPIEPVSAPASSGAEGVEWATIGLGAAGGLLAVGALAVFTVRRSRRTRRLSAAV
jgi:hypothetical protein